MITQAIVNLGIVGLTYAILLLYLVRFVFRYKHQYESNRLCTSIVIFCLLVVLIATFVLPVDIFLVSYVKEPDGTFKEWATNATRASIDKAVHTAYYSLYGITIFLIFVVIPFLHFFNEESESNSRDRLHKAIICTFGFAMLMTILLLFGAFMNTSLPDPSLIINKIMHLAQTTKVQNAIIMVLTIVTGAGFLNVSFYTASGIFSWPVGLMLGTSSLANRVNAVNDREVLLRMRINNLEEKARASRLTPTEREQLIEAQNDLRELEREEAALSGYSDSWAYRFRKAIRPFQVITGCIFGALSILLMTTLITVNVDRVLHGAGFKQGYVLLEPMIFNPLEYVYTKLQDLIVIGPMPLLIVTCFLVVATISGIRNLGLWLLFVRMHRIKVGRTQPQALLYLCVTLMLATLAFNLTLYSMTTQYVTFGDQKFRQEVNGITIVKPCSLKDYNEDCILTRSSVLLMRMMSQVWIVGAIFYWWGWVFVVIGAISLVAYLVRGRREASHGIISDQDEFED